MITTKNLFKYYGADAAVNDVSFTIESGDIVGLLGLNGAGKTTTLRILSGLLVPTSGSVQIDGIDMAEHPEQARAKIGFLPETPPLYPEMTVEEFLTFVAQINGVPRREVAGAVQAAVAAVDLGERSKHAIGTLSHGYKRRVGIAHALVHRPSLILLDEPTSGLDPQQVKHMRQLVRNLRQKHTVVVSSHILGEIQHICDRILVMQDGRIIAEGTADELIHRAEASSSICVEVKGTPELLAAALSKAAEVVRHRIDREHEGLTEATVELRGNTPELVSQAIVESGLGLRKIGPASGELENVFLALTSAETASRPATRAEARVGTTVRANPPMPNPVSETDHHA